MSDYEGETIMTLEDSFEEFCNGCNKCPIEEHLHPFGIVECKSIYKKMFYPIFEQHEKMKNCSNCRHYKEWCDEFDEEKYICERWEIKE